MRAETSAREHRAMSQRIPVVASQPAYYVLFPHPTVRHGHKYVAVFFTDYRLIIIETTWGLYKIKMFNRAFVQSQ